MSTPSAQSAAYNALWQQHLEDLAAFQKEHGHCCVSTLSKTHASLGNWVRTQRGQRKRGRLNREQIRLLDNLGFSWGPQVEDHQARWDAMYVALIEFQKENGHCRVPGSNPVYAKLAKWVKVQRRAKRKRYLSAERTRRLDALGFFPAFGWESKYEALAAYQRAHGDCLVTGKEYPNLGKWVIAQRCLRRTGKLSAERIRRLDVLGVRLGSAGAAVVGDVRRTGEVQKGLRRLRRAL